MMSNNKILTVSYGTFSCTLEGFDDSFDTMKAIAEYFRDLASDDRYFGAEPPQPDAEMLARIAEREIARHVEAHASEAGIHLRVGATAALNAAEAPVTPKEPPADAPTPAADAATSAQPADAVVDVAAPYRAPHNAAPTPELQAEPSYAPHASPAEDADHGLPGGDRLAAIPPQPAADPAFAHDEAIAPAGSETADFGQASLNHAMLATAGPAAPAPDVTPAHPPMAEQSPPPAWQPDAHAAHHAPSADDAAARVAEAQSHDDIPLAEDMPVPLRRPAPNSIADKLQRIRAVVSKTPPIQASYSEDQHAEQIVEAEESDDAARMAEFFARGTGEAARNIEEPADTEEELFAQMEHTDETEAPADPIAAEQDSDADTGVSATADDAEDAEFAATLARLDEEWEAEAAPTDDVRATGQDDTDADTDEPEADDFDVSAFLEDDTQTGDDTPPVPQGDTPDAPDALLPALRARVIKVKRSEIRAALDAGMLEEDNDNGDQADGPEAEDDADQQGMASAAPDTEFAPEIDQPGSGPVDDDIPPARQLQDAAGTDEDELDRLMAEAAQQMDEPDGNSRRAAFDHLRGAVEATKADDDLGTDEDATDEDAYRIDLAAAVTPRRPVSGGRTDRPRDQRPAPLKLIAEQRIDVPTARTGPVQPRRVAAATVPESGDSDGSFADYAASRGARELPELLEAAASYLSFVEGHDEFSRPQLMTKVRQLDPDGFSREDGLRHFGKLLRSGKIEKIKGGRFTVSDDIGFRPDGERAAG